MNHLLKPMFLIALILWVSFISGSPLEAADKGKTTTGKQWLDMDYGPYLTTTVEASQPKGNFAYKGIVIRVGEKQEQTIIFDTDTLRYSAGLSNSYIALSGIVFDGKHWAYPTTNGPYLFTNPVGPGWGKTGATADKRFADTRFRGNDGKPYGPLPHDVGHWKGLYLHGSNVVFSYTVSDTAILEMPAGEPVADSHAITRTLHIAPSKETLHVQLATLDGKPGTASEKGNTRWFTTTEGADKNAAAYACIASDDSKATFEVDGDNLRLAIAAHDKAITLKLILWRGDGKQLDAAVESVKQSKPAVDVKALTQGGPPRWAQKVTTQGKTGETSKKSPWTTDEITLPVQNPWNSWMRLGGFDFFKDGTRAAICTWSGDVWIVTGITPGKPMSDLTWQRIATGMFQPLGLRIVDEQIYVTCRDQITRLHDLNGDGETDYYENFNNDHQVTEHFHEFAMGLQTDDAGNFYYAKSGQHARDSLVEQHGTLLKVSKDGKSTEILANGYRAANGVGIGPAGTFFTSDQEGFWMPANRINLVQKDSFSGNMYSYHRGQRPTDYDRPIVWLPKPFDRSPAEQVWVRDDRWGLPKDSIISLSYGTGHILSVIYEPIKDVKHVNAQGAAFRLGIQFPTGIMRGRFHPADGQLYACGLFGWSSDRTSPGGFWRIRYTGAKVNVPVGYHVANDGIVLTFNHALDPETANDVDSYAIEQWDYKWTKNYGSPEFKLSDGTKGRDTIKLASAKLDKDGKTVKLTIPDLKPSMQIRIQCNLDAADGSEIKQDLYGSIFVVPQGK